MSFREKIIWVTLLAGIGPYVWYFGSIALALAAGSGEAALSMSGLVKTLIWGTVVMAAATAVAAIYNRNEGSMIPDERESIIERRGIFAAYHFLCAGILLVIVAGWLGLSGIALIHLLTLAFIAAEFLRLAIELHSLRRGY